MNHCWILAPSSERADLRFYCGECWRSYGRMSCGAGGGAAREPTSFPLPWMQPTSELAVRMVALASVPPLLARRVQYVQIYAPSQAL